MSSRLPPRGDGGIGHHRLASKLLRPRIDLIERPQDFRLFVNLPGGDLDAVDLQIEGGVLSLSARVQADPTAGLAPEGASDGSSEGASGRAITWQLNVDFSDLLADDALQAVFEGGVLLVTLPKAEGLEGTGHVQLPLEEG